MAAAARPARFVSDANSDAREGQREQRDGDGGRERAPVYEARFAAQLGDEIVIVKRLFARVEFARAACGERDSSLLARLQ